MYEQPLDAPGPAPRLGVMGLGVVGGTLADALAEAGYHVDKYDPQHQNYNVIKDLDGVEAAFVCVWTPMEYGQLNEDYVFQAVEQLMSLTYPPEIIVIRSTIRPGTMTELEKRHGGQRFAFIPEFLVEADPAGSMRHADRIVIGATDTMYEQYLGSIFNKVTPGSPILYMEPEEAVMVKLASNAMLAAKVALANELALISEAYDVRWEQVQAGVGLDRRIGADHMTVTERRGYGGSCFPKDMRGLVNAAEKAGVDPLILHNIEVANGKRYTG